MQYKDRKRKAEFNFYFLTLGKWALLPTFSFLAQTNQQPPKWSYISDGASFVTKKDAYKHLLLQKRWRCCSCSKDWKRKMPNGQNLQILNCYKFLTLKSVESCWLVFTCSPPFLQCDKEIQLWNNEKPWLRNVIKDNILKYLHNNKAKSFFGRTQ